MSDSLLQFKLFRFATENPQAAASPDKLYAHFLDAGYEEDEISQAIDDLVDGKLADYAEEVNT